MPSRLEKARQDPASMKARILASARRKFGEYGYGATTTRLIAKDVGIDISTLYYHWGEKQDLYEAVIMDITDEFLLQCIRDRLKPEHRPAHLPGNFDQQMAIQVSR